MEYLTESWFRELDWDVGQKLARIKDEIRLYGKKTLLRQSDVTKGEKLLAKIEKAKLALDQAYLEAFEFLNDAGGV